MRPGRLGPDLLMALVAPGVVVSLLLAAGDPEVRFRLRQNPWTARQDFEDCRASLSSLGTALEMYSTDASGRYPPDLARLAPRYVKALPTCPARGRVTVSYVSTAEPDAYTMECSGSNHEGAGVDEDEPSWNSGDKA